jgi:hypothetical protein
MNVLHRRLPEDIGSRRFLLVIGMYQEVSGKRYLLACGVGGYIYRTYRTANYKQKLTTSDAKCTVMHAFVLLRNTECIVRKELRVLGEKCNLEITII